MAHRGRGSRVRAPAERSEQTGLVYCEPHHWWLGYSLYVKGLADHPMVGKLGPNALDLPLEEFRGLLRGRRGRSRRSCWTRTGSPGSGMCISRIRCQGEGPPAAADPDAERRGGGGAVAGDPGDAAGEHRRRRRAVRAEPVRAEGRMECQLPGGVPGGQAVPGVRDGGGKDQDGEHEQLCLSRAARHWSRNDRRLGATAGSALTDPEDWQTTAAMGCSGCVRVAVTVPEQSACAPARMVWLM
jgi:hypothetical protein